MERKKRKTSRRNHSLSRAISNCYFTHSLTSLYLSRIKLHASRGPHTLFVQPLPTDCFSSVEVTGVLKHAIRSFIEPPPPLLIRTQLRTAIVSLPNGTSPCSQPSQRLAFNLMNDILTYGEYFYFFLEAAAHFRPPVCWHAFRLLPSDLGRSDRVR